MAKVLVTGANGFVGGPLTVALRAAGHAVVPVVRDRHAQDSAAVAVGDIGEFDQWRPLLQDVDTVVHLAARTHVTREEVSQPLVEFRRINVAASCRLAQSAASAGVRRFVFVSSIRVNGPATGDRPFVESDEPRPLEPYEISKWEAERALVEIGASTGMQIIRVRPTLIVGPGAKGNLNRLMRMVDLGFPLPFGSIQNKRSLIGVGSLIELLVLCVAYRGSINELFFAADEQQISTPELLRLISQGFGRKSAFLLPVPAVLLRMGGRLVNRAAIDRVMLSLCADARRAKEVLNWKPRSEIRDAVLDMAQCYMRARRRSV